MTVNSALWEGSTSRSKIAQAGNATIASRPAATAVARVDRFTSASKAARRALVCESSSAMQHPPNRPSEGGA